MVFGKKVKLEGKSFLFGLPTGDMGGEKSSLWDEALERCPDIFRQNTVYGTLCQELNTDDYCVVRGRWHPENFERENSYHDDESLGFRPVLWPLDANGEFDARFFKGYPDGTVLKAYSLLLNGRPVKADGTRRMLDPEAEILLIDKFYRDEYLIPWVVINGCAMSATILLRGMCWDDLSMQGFLEPGFML